MSSDNEAKMFSFERLFESYPTTMRKIIQNIPLNLRFDVGAINEQFYELLCELDKSKYKIKIKGEIESSNKLKPFYIDDIVSSILMSRRREFDELQLECLILNTNNLQQLIKVADKHGKNIKILRMENCSLQDWTLFSELLEKIPFLEDWTVNKCFRVNKNANSIQPVLKNLKKFHLWGSEKYSDFIGADTLQSLCFQGQDHLQFDWNGEVPLSNLIRSQSMLRFLKYFIINGIENDTKYAMDLRPLENLEEIEIRAKCDEVFIRELVRDHPSLKKLNLGVSSWSEETFLTIISHANRLESFAFQWYPHYLEIPRLKNLKEIEVLLFGGYGSLFMDFAKLSMPNIKTLTFKIYMGPTMKHFDFTDALESFGKHWENIEELRVDYDNPHQNLDADRILQSFRLLKSLMLKNFIKAENDVKYPLLEELLILGGTTIQLLSFIKAFPNLKHLRVVNYFGYLKLKDLVQSNAFQHLACLEKLRELEMIVLCDEAPSSECIDAIKQLCLKVPNFCIEIKSNNESYWRKFIDNDFCKVSKYEKSWREDSEFYVKLTNFKY